MTATLLCHDGAEYVLPPLTDWSVCHTLGVPADSFELCCPCSAELLPVLEKAAEVRGVWNGETVLAGVVDEFEFAVSEEGRLVTVSGRGMAARLLDNESEPVQYVYCTLEDILANHVRPCGIENMRVAVSGTAGGYLVESGASQWTALENFTKYVCGVIPRFSPDGTLILAPESGRTLSVGPESAVGKLSFTKKRYGVVSSVTVRYLADNRRDTVQDDSALAEGIRCHRVITVPRNPGYESRRYTGQYQIEASKKDTVLCTLTLPTPFSAFPGDSVKLDEALEVPGANWLVTETLSWADRRGCGTRMTMRRK